MARIGDLVRPRSFNVSGGRSQRVENPALLAASRLFGSLGEFLTEKDARERQEEEDVAERERVEQEAVAERRRQFIGGFGGELEGAETLEGLDALDLAAQQAGAQEQVSGPIAARREGLAKSFSDQEAQDIIARAQQFSSVTGLDRAREAKASRDVPSGEEFMIGAARSGQLGGGFAGEGVRGVEQALSGARERSAIEERLRTSEKAEREAKVEDAISVAKGKQDLKPADEPAQPKVTPALGKFLTPEAILDFEAGRLSIENIDPSIHFKPPDEKVTARQRAIMSIAIQIIRERQLNKAEFGDPFTDQDQLQVIRDAATAVDLTLEFSRKGAEGVEIDPLVQKAASGAQLSPEEVARLEEILAASEQ